MNRPQGRFRIFPEAADAQAITMTRSRAALTDERPELGNCDGLGVRIGRCIKPIRPGGAIRRCPVVMARTCDTHQASADRAGHAQPTGRWLSTAGLLSEAGPRVSKPDRSLASKWPKSRVAASSGR